MFEPFIMNIDEGGMWLANLEEWDNAVMMSLCWVSLPLFVFCLLNIIKQGVENTC